ncbi:MAG: MFS transporter [Opitutaceae bacterium]|nr:MFS transporter [Opitutaceae bacterium]
MIVTITVFMKYSDRSFRTRKTLWAIGAIMQTVGYGIFLVLPFNIPTVVANIALFACGCALAGEAFYKVFSQELFPTILRGTAQGFTFGVARAILAAWSIFVPMLTALDIRWVAGLLTLFLAISGIVGFFGMPDTSGKSLEQIEAERA